MLLFQVHISLRALRHFLQILDRLLVQSVNERIEDRTVVLQETIRSVELFAFACVHNENSVCIDDRVQTVGN